MTLPGTSGTRLGVLCIGVAGDAQPRWSRESVERLFGRTPARPGVPRQSIADYWADCSDGEIDLGAAFVTPWVELGADHPVWAAVDVCDGPGPAGHSLLKRTLQQLCDAALGQLSADDRADALLGTDCDALLILTTRTSPLHWTYRAHLVDRWLPTAYLTIGATHSTMAHEVGHLLGYEHSYGLVTDGVGAEYGDPYCIMSARRFGGRADNVTRPLPAWDLLPGAPLWSMAGPRLARAVAWTTRWDWPETQDSDVHTVELDALPDKGSQVRRVRIAHCAVPRGEHPRLVALRHGSGSWFTLEIRGPHPLPVPEVDWDGAMRLDRHSDTDQSDAGGLVVHEVVEHDPPDDVFPGVRRTTYRGTVPLPMAGDTDLVIDAGGDRLVVRLEDYVDGVATVVVSDRHGPPAAWAHVSEDELPDGGRRVTVQAMTRGFERPHLSWRVAGTMVASAMRLGDPLVRNQIGGRRRAVFVEARWDQLQVDVAAAPGPGALPVEITVHEGASGSDDGGGGAGGAPSDVVVRIDPFASVVDRRVGRGVGPRVRPRVERRVGRRAGLGWRRWLRRS